MAFVTRTVDRNFLPSSFTLLRQAGVNHANNPTSAFIPHLDEQRLAEILRVPVEEVAKRRHLPRPDTGYVDFFGSAVRGDEIIVRTLRFAPRSVGASPHHRALWSLKAVPCCTESWEYLSNTCVCGSLQRWQHAKRFDRCVACNRRLDQQNAVTVPVEQRDTLTFLIGLLDPDPAIRAAARSQLPKSLADWDGGMVFELALALLPLTATGYCMKRGRTPPLADVRTYTGALSEAATMVRSWPESIYPALSAAVAKRSTSKKNARYLGIDAHLAGIHGAILPDLVHNTLHSALATISSDAGSTPPDQIGMRDAALLTGHTEHALAAARRAGRLMTRTCLRANRLLPTLDRKEIEYVDDFLRNRIGPDRAAAKLGLPRYAIEMLVAHRLIVPEAHAYLVDTYGAHQIHKREHRLFLARIQQKGSMSRSLLDRPVALHRVARAMGGGLKPWGQIFRDLNDRVPYSMTGTTISGIWIGKKYTEELLAMDLSRTVPPVDCKLKEIPVTNAIADLSKGCSQRDACEILNLPLKHVGEIHQSWVPSLNGRYDWGGIQTLAAERITLAEMSARTGVHGTTLETSLEKAKLPRLDGFGWLRTRCVLDFIASIKVDSDQRKRAVAVQNA